MATLHDFFVAEAADQLGRFDAALDRGEEASLEELHRAARALRGTAQIAREDAAQRGAGVLETATRALMDGDLTLDRATLDRLRASAEDLRAIARGADAESRAAAIAARWAEIGVSPRPRTQPDGGVREAREFLEFAAREVVGIAHELERSVDALAAEPTDAESLKAVVRRQRALLGAARLEEIPVVAETLRAVEDMAAIIARLGVAVRHEWLEVFSAARDVLRAAVSPLETGRQPEAGTAFGRLRILREELLARHGTDDSVSPAAGAEAARGGAPPAPPPQGRAPALSREEAVQAPPRSDKSPPPPSGAPATAASATSDGVDIRALLYRGDAALARAAELRPVLERMLEGQRGGREALAELYDLLRLARE